MHAGQTCIRTKIMKLAYGVDDTNLQINISSTRCKQWDCPFCAQLNMLEYKRRMMYGYKTITDTGQEMGFITLTMPGHIRTVADGVERWAAVWDKLSQRSRRHHRKLGIDHYYVLIPEAGLDGHFHVHGFFSHGNSQRWWKDNCAATGLGFMAEIDQIWNSRIAGQYLTKYLTKSMGELPFPKRFRRVRFSRNYPQPPKRQSPIHWRSVPGDMPVADLVARWQKFGYSVRRQVRYLA